MDIAAFMTWIRETIMKMGGMQTCDLVYEEMNPEGHFLQVLIYVHSRHKYIVCTAHICHFVNKTWGTSDIPPVLPFKCVLR